MNTDMHIGKPKGEIPCWHNVDPCSLMRAVPHPITLKVIYARFPLAGIDVIVKFWLTCSPLTYSVALDAYHIDSVTTCYD